jgi:hypothetical protein
MLFTGDRYMNFFTLMIVACLIAGCVHRPPPQPVAVKQANDTNLTCEQITVDYTTNTEIAKNKIVKNKASDVDDALWIIFVWPGLADFQNADGNEGNALLDRNIYLREMAKAKGCKGIETWSRQPERYTLWTTGIDRGA